LVAGADVLITAGESAPELITRLQAGQTVIGLPRTVGRSQEAVRLGADAVGYTLYVGSPAQERDFAQYL
jgi:DhnA family fructose-bisphosphate aldolase class Ia